MKESEAKIGVKVRVIGDTVGGISLPIFKGLIGVIKEIKGKGKSTFAFYNLIVRFNKDLGLYGHSYKINSTKNYYRYGNFYDFEIIKKRGKKKC